MALLVSTLLEHIAHTIRGEGEGGLNAPNYGLAIINEAGQYLANMHDWRWLQRPATELSLRGPLSAITSATFTASSKNLAKTGAFANYTFLTGDQVKVTGGTAVTAKKYEIASKTDDDNIVLVADITTDASNPTDVTATMDFDAAALPDNIKKINGYDATESLVNSLEMTTVDHLNSLRTNQIEVSSWNFWGAIVYGRPQGASLGRPVPRLELWPEIPGDDPNGLTIFWSERWTNVDADADQVPIPEFCDTAFIQLVRSFARGYDDEDEATLGQRLTEWRLADYTVMAMQADGEIQPDWGWQRGGAIQEMPRGTNRFLRSSVAGPS